MSTEIQIAKKQVKLKNWMEEAETCRSSELTVQHWCEINGMSVKMYNYYHLRKVREAMLQESSRPIGKSIRCNMNKIEISSGNLKISLLEGCDADTITAVLKVLKYA